MEQAGYRVVAVPDGKEALDRLAAEPGAFDLVILDMVMPKLGGRQTYDRINEFYPRLPVLFTSGYSPHAMDLDFLSQRGMQLIPKPFARAESLGTVRHVLDGSL